MFEQVDRGPRRFQHLRPNSRDFGTASNILAPQKHQNSTQLLGAVWRLFFWQKATGMEMARPVPEMFANQRICVRFEGVHGKFIQQNGIWLQILIK